MRGKLNKRRRVLPALLVLAFLFLMSCSSGTANGVLPSAGAKNSNSAGTYINVSPNSSSSGAASDVSSSPAESAAQQMSSSGVSTQQPAQTVAAQEVAQKSTSPGNAKKSNSSSSPASSAPASSQATSSPQSTGTVPPAQSGKYVVGYYAGWSSYSGFTPDKIKAADLTHILYAFAKIDGGLRAVLDNPANDVKNLAALKQLKAQNSRLNIMISVGGWDYSTYFSDAACTASNRETFAQSCVDLVKTYGLDGVDLDWEYPVTGGMVGNINRAADKQNFTLLLQAVRAKFDALGAATGKKYYLSIAGGAGSSYMTKIEPQGVAAATDFVFIMAYDMHGSWDSYADFNAPLYVPSEPSPQYQISVSNAVNAYLNAGVPSSKLVLGMPFYGHKYTVTSSANNGLYSPFTAYSSVSYDDVAAGYIGKSPYQVIFHPTARVPYLFGNNTFISYENVQSIQEKVQLANTRGLRGVGAWELSQDKNATLLSAAYGALN